MKKIYLLVYLIPLSQQDGLTMLTRKSLRSRREEVVITTTEKTQQLQTEHVSQVRNRVFGFWK